MSDSRTEKAKRTIVITGGSDGMGRALALERASRGDRVVAVGSTRARGERLAADAAGAGLGHLVEFVAADLGTAAGNRAVVDHVGDRYPEGIDALVLGANRPFPRRTETVDGLESTFALYYLSRYLLGHGLLPALERRPSPVIVNVAGVGATAGEIHWDDLQLRRRYGTVAAQLQAGRANDLLGVAMAERYGARVPYVLFHPGFTRSGRAAAEHLRPAARFVIRTLTVLAARPVKRAVAPVHGFIESPPRAPLSAVDRGRALAPDLKTLDPAAARRLDEVTARLVSGLAAQGPPDGG